MPCVRMYPHRFHHGPRHHPWMGSHGCRGAELGFFLSQQMDGTHKASFDEVEDAYMVRMDVPGVKANQITIEEKDGEVEIVAIRMENEEVTKTYQDILFVDPYKADIENSEALLADGVLTLKIPRKFNNNDSMEIQVIAANPPPVQEALDAGEFRLTIDIPGVKPSDIKLKFVNNVLVIRGERFRGQEQTVLTRRVFEIPRGVDPTEARAFMLDGVFTLVASKVELKPSALRIIHVNDVPSMEDLHINDQVEQVSVEDTKKQDEDEVMVETVTEEKEWEHVGDANASAEK